MGLCSRSLSDGPRFGPSIGVDHPAGPQRLNLAEPPPRGPYRTIRGSIDRWRSFAGKQDIAYRSHVLMGLVVRNRRYNSDPDLLVGGYGHRVAVDGLVGLERGVVDAAVEGHVDAVPQR
jgi:hypothetical protein